MKRVILLQTALFCLFISCSSKSQDYPFSKDRKFFYRVTQTGTDGVVKTDTLSFKVLPHDGIKLLMGVTKIGWYNAQGKEWEKRGLNAQDGHYELQLPTNIPLLENEMTALSGHPSAWTESKPGYNSEAEHIYFTGYGKFTGIKFTQKTLHLRDTVFTFNDKRHPVQEYESENTSHIGQFGKSICTYTFNKDLGFTTISYQYPSGNRIEFILFKTE